MYTSNIEASTNPDGTQNILVCGRMYYAVDEDGEQDELECYNSKE